MSNVQLALEKVSGFTFAAVLPSSFSSACTLSKALGFSDSFLVSSCPLALSSSIFVVSAGVNVSLGPSRDAPNSTLPAPSVASFCSLISTTPAPALSSSVSFAGVCSTSSCSFSLGVTSSRVFCCFLPLLPLVGEEASALRLVPLVVVADCGLELFCAATRVDWRVPAMVDGDG